MFLGNSKTAVLLVIGVLVENEVHTSKSDGGHRIMDHRIQYVLRSTVDETETSDLSSVNAS